MARRAASPAAPEWSRAYLSAIAGSGFIAVPAARRTGANDIDEDDDARTVTDIPPYQARNSPQSAQDDKKGPRAMPSQSGASSTSAPAYDFGTPTPYHLSPFSRPDHDGQSVRSEGVFNFSDDRSIMPEDSVSQLQRGFTGKRPLGPRAMQPLPTMQEHRDDDGISFVPTPEMIRLEGPEATPSASRYAGEEQNDYTREEEPEEEHVESYRSIRDSAHSTSRTPLVQSAAPMAGVAYPYESRSGYAPPSQDDEYSAYKNRDVDLEHAPYARDREEMDEKKGFFAGAMSSPMAFIRSVSSSGGQSSNSSYPPAQYDHKAFTTPGDEDPENMRPAALWRRLFWDTTPDARRKWERQNHVGLYRHAYACWTLAAAMLVALIIELVRTSSVTGKPIQTKPSFNVMIGPPGEMLINFGARFAGCMKFVPGVSDINWVCLANSNQATVTAEQATCTMSQICGFGGFPANEPDQSFRFILPIFLHAGIVHLLVNMLAQLSSSSLVEKQMGAPKFLVVYFLSGIFGFVLGSNFALVGQPSVGASGAIFGTHAAFLVDLVAHWSLETRPKRKLFFLFVEIVIGFGIGYAPGIDNFAHLGGFLMGLLCSILLLPVIAESRRRKIVWIVLRLLAAALVVVLFVVLVRNFYQNDPNKMCSWCRYLSCWPTSSNNRCKGTGIATVSAETSASFVTIIFTTLVTLF